MSPERLDATFAALADPTRRAILARLAAGDASVAELAKPFAMSQPAISKHLKVLERAGLISAHHARAAASPPPRSATARRSDGVPRALSRVLGEKFRRLDDLLEELKATDTNAAPTKRKRT